MRLWTIHPQYLDAKGLVALWREGLLAQKVLMNETRGYKHHPQLIRFKNISNSTGAIASYLRCVYAEAEQRGYRFNGSKIASRRITKTILVNSGQIEFEFKHLLGKLKQRAPDLYAQLKDIRRVRLHPLFAIRKGGIEEWEVTD